LCHRIGDGQHSDRVRERQRPGPIPPSREPESAWRQCHRHHVHQRQLGSKRLQLLRLLNPKTAIIAVLVNPKNPNAADAKIFEAAGKTLGVEIVIVQASTQAELIEAFTQAVQRRADALLVHVDALFNDVGET
jgi:hypothetical protein